MKDNLTLLFVFLFSFFASSQNVKIDWDGKKVIDYGRNKVALPFFKNEGFSYESSSIYINVFQKSSSENATVQNFIWERVSPSDVYDLNYLHFPTRENYDIANYTDPYTKEKSQTIKVSAFKYENGTIFRLSSFNIVNGGFSSNRKANRDLIGSTENPLKSGSFYKIKVDKSGVFKITTKFLRDNGINPANVNPKNFRVYGNGGLMLPEHNRDTRYAALQENAIQVMGENDGAWNEEDFAIFYAQGPNGYNLYKTPGDSNGSGNRRIETRNTSTYNFINIYDNFSYYFINFDLGPGKRIQDMDETTSSNIITRYDEYQYINEEKFNLMKIGRIWTGDSFDGNKTVSFTTKSPIQQNDVIKFKSRVIGYQSQGNKITANINGKNVQDYNLANMKDDYIRVFYEGVANGFSGNQISFNYSPNTSSNPNGKFYFDFAEVQYKEDLKFNGSQMNFRDYGIQEGSGNTYTFNVSDASTAEQVWDVSDITNVSRKVNKSGTSSNFIFGYSAASDVFYNEFVIFNKNAAFEPSFVGKIENQDLSSLQNIEYLIVTTKEMMGHAQRLANYYQGKYSTAVVDVNKIYNEFSSGSKDITAIRDFATKLKSTGSLKYIFILGDTSYDFKGISVPNSDIIPGYQSEESGNYAESFITDDYYGMTLPQTVPLTPVTVSITSLLPAVPVGRLPAANISEAKLLIDKTLAYYNALPGQSTPFGEWRMKLDFVADDDNDGWSATNPLPPFHTELNNSIKENFEDSADKKEYNIKKLYLDAFTATTSAGGQRYPQVNQAISNDVGNSLYLFYFGHGGINGWAQERVLSSDEINNFNNYNNVYSRFPLVSTITCEFTLWDDPDTLSAGERVIKSNQGGAATMITSSRAIGVDYGRDFTAIFTRQIFNLTNDEFQNLGDAFLQAKIIKKANANHLKVNFLGDPAMKMSRPKRLIEITGIESPVQGQLRALDFVKVKGIIKKGDGTLDDTFNGRVAVNIFDKRLNKETLNNDKVASLEPKLKFTEEGSPIVKSSGQAISGRFSVDFYVPKDINYEIGSGRILVYADNKVFDVFNNQAQTVGGINPTGIDDSEPPKVNLYMNNTNFADGGITNQNPTFLACVTDNKGINSTGSGIGHDITVILDGQIINTVVLNDFYFSGEGNGCVNPNLADYQKGNVTYPFRNLSPGPHQVTFKVWDINNNSTTATLNFVVKDESSQKLVVNKLLNWPNPFTNKTYVQFEHNCNDILDVNVQIFTITGKLVRTLTTQVSGEPFLQGFRTPRTAIEWDGKDDFGDAVGKGTYIFKILAKAQNQDKCKGSVTAVEKMVLLR